MTPPLNDLSSGLIHDGQYYRGLSEDYYRRVSPLCRRLLDDMTAVRQAWGEDWHQLSYVEQCRLLDQAIVDEETVQKYYKGKLNGPECEYYPRMKLPTGQKIVCDESLSARGYTCSWRDEHSAPFSWHTRSQMDLTLDTPPMTPPNVTSPTEEARIITGPGNVYKSRPLSLHINRPPGFTWHYDPITPVAPDPPDLVLGATHTQQTQAIPESNSQGAHLVIRADEEPMGIMNRLKGVFSRLSTACFPIHACRGAQPMHTLHHTPSMQPPELRPPHVLAQASKPSKKNSLTGSQHSFTGVKSTRSGRSSFDKLSPTSPTVNVHSSLKSLYGYYDVKQADEQNGNIAYHNSDAKILFQNKSNESINRASTDPLHKKKSNGSLHKNLNLYDGSKCSRSTLASHDDVTTYPSRTATTTHSNSLMSNSSWALSSQFQDSPTLTLRSSPQSLYKQDSNANSQTSLGVDNSNITAINVQNNLKAHFRIHERPKVDEVTFRIKKDPSEDKKKLLAKESPDEVRKPLMDAKSTASPAEEKRPVPGHAAVQRKYSDEEDLPHVDLSTSEAVIPKTGFDFLDNW